MKMVLCIHLAVRPNKALPCKTVNFIMYKRSIRFRFFLKIYDHCRNIGTNIRRRKYSNGKIHLATIRCILNEIIAFSKREINYPYLRFLLDMVFKEAVVVVSKRIFRHLLSSMERNKRHTYTCPTLGKEGFKTREYRADFIV